jgi:hypothetical protein
MRGLDGNYLNAQGDALSRMQMVYQSEQNRQQIQAQVGAQDALRKLREQVNESEEAGTAHGSRVVGEDQGSGEPGGKKDPLERGPKKGREPSQGPTDDLGSISHIDIRV